MKKHITAPAKEEGTSSHRKSHSFFSSFSSPFIGVSAALLSAIFFSSKAVFIKLAYGYGIEPVPLLTLRMLMAAPFFLFLYLYSVLQSGVSENTLCATDYCKVFFLGLLGYYLASVFDFYALSFISAGLERMLLFVYPTFTVLLGVVLLRKRVRVKLLLSLMISYGGVVLLFVSEEREGTSEDVLLGGFLVLVSAFCYACYLFFSSSFVKKVGTIPFTSLVALSATLAVFGHFLFVSEVSDLLVVGEVYFYAFLMAVFSTVLPFLLLAEGLKRIGAEKSALIGTTGPVSTFFFASLFLNEEITFIKIAGSLLVMIGVLLITVRNGNIRRG